MESCEWRRAHRGNVGVGECGGVFVYLGYPIRHGFTGGVDRNEYEYVDGRWDGWIDEGGSGKGGGEGEGEGDGDGEEGESSSRMYVLYIPVHTLHHTRLIPREKTRERGREGNCPDDCCCSSRIHVASWRHPPVN